MLGGSEAIPVDGNTVDVVTPEPAGSIRKEVDPPAVRRERGIECFARRRESVVERPRGVKSGMELKCSIAFDATDLPAEVFMPAGEAWLRCRQRRSAGESHRRTLESDPGATDLPAQSPERALDAAAIPPWLANG
jgi:hypothetical protein